MIGRICKLWIWAAGTWLLLTWTVTFEQLVFGGLLATAWACALAPLGPVASPWRMLDPRIAFAAARVVVEGLLRIMKANVGLAVRIWRPSRPLASGMIIVPTGLRSDGGVGGVGLITSLIVDNQITDLDRRNHLLQYHAVAVPEGGTAERVSQVNGPVERMLAPLTREKPVREEQP